MPVIRYELELDSFTNIEVSAVAQTQKVELYITQNHLDDDGEHHTTRINMSHVMAERLWHAIKGCVDYAVRPQQ